MSDTPHAANDAPKVAPESDPKPAVQNNEADHKTPPDTPKRK